MEQRPTGTGAHRLSRNDDPYLAGQERRQFLDPRFHLFRKMTGQQHEFRHAEADEFTQQPREEGPVAARQQRFRRSLGQRAETRAQPTGKHGALTHSCAPQVHALPSAPDQPVPCRRARRPSRAPRPAKTQCARLPEAPDAAASAPGLQACESRLGSADPAGNASTSARTNAPSPSSARSCRAP